MGDDSTTARSRCVEAGGESSIVDPAVTRVASRPDPAKESPARMGRCFCFALCVAARGGVSSVMRPAGTRDFRWEPGRRLPGA